MIVFDNVSLRYPYDEFSLFKDMSFTLDYGVNTVLCDTQSGTTSICKLLMKEDSPTNGKIFFDGVDIGGIANRSLGILYLPGNPSLFLNKSVKYNLEYPLRIRRTDKNQIKDAVLSVAEKVGISDLCVRVKKLSGYERKKAALARGLTIKRKAVLLDDFFEDSTETEDIASVLNLFTDSITVIFTSCPHLACGNTVVLDGGRVVYQGDSQTAKEKVSGLGWLNDSLKEL